MAHATDTINEWNPRDINTEPRSDDLPTVQQAIDGLRKQQAVLAELVSSLQERLTPILDSRPGPVAAAVPDPEPPPVDMLRDLFALRGEQHYAVDKLRWLLDRIAL